MDQAGHRGWYEFGEFRLDAGRRVLSRRMDGARVAITPKVFDASLYLVERAGALVPKARLLADLWPGVVVEENSLTQVISDLRRALGETRSEHRYVVTVPRRGYQFVGEVVRMPGAQIERDATDRTVAVLPFDNPGGRTDAGMIASGIAEGILHRLTATAGLRLVAQPAAFGSRGAFRDARTLGRRLAARYLVEGSVQRAGRRVRITAQLIDTADGSPVWSRMFDRAATDVFALEDDVSLHVAREVRASVLRGAVAPPAE